jgi:hypothetical protein
MATYCDIIYLRPAYGALLFSSNKAYGVMNHLYPAFGDQMYNLCPANSALPSVHKPGIRDQLL